MHSKSNARSNFFSQEGYKPYYMSRVRCLGSLSRDERDVFWMILLIMKENYQLSLYTGGFWVDK